MCHVKRDVTRPGRGRGDYPASDCPRRGIRGPGLAAAIGTANQEERLTGGVQVVTDAQIQAAVQGWIADIPVPAATANTLYFAIPAARRRPCLAQRDRARITVAKHSHIVCV